MDAMRREITEVEQQCSEVEGQCAGWQAKIADTNAETRVESHILWRGWAEELARLEEKRDQLERDLQPLVAHRDKCKRDAGGAVFAKARYITGLAFPFTSELAQQTQAYVQYRLPFTYQAAPPRPRTILTVIVGIAEGMVRMAEHTPPRKKKISVAWIVAFVLLLGLTVLLGILSTPPGTTGPGTTVPGTTANAPDLTAWVAISALGTAVAGIGALISGVAAVSAVRASARQGTTRTQTPARSAKKSKRRR